MVKIFNSYSDNSFHLYPINESDFDVSLKEDIYGILVDYTKITDKIVNSKLKIFQELKMYNLLDHLDRYNINFRSDDLLYDYKDLLAREIE